MLSVGKARDPEFGFVNFSIGREYLNPPTLLIELICMMTGGAFIIATLNDLNFKFRTYS